MLFSVVCVASSMHDSLFIIQCLLQPSNITNLYIFTIHLSFYSLFFHNFFFIIFCIPLCILLLHFVYIFLCVRSIAYCLCKNIYILNGLIKERKIIIIIINMKLFDVGPCALRWMRARGEEEISIMTVLWHLRLFLIIRYFSFLSFQKSLFFWWLRKIIEAFHGE